MRPFFQTTLGAGLTEYVTLTFGKADHGCYRAPGWMAALIAVTLLASPALAIDSYSTAEMQMRQSLVASKNRRDMHNTNPNFPDTARLTISSADFNRLKSYFSGLQTHDSEFSHLYPANQYRFEVATSGSVGHLSVHDLKISPILPNKNSGPAIFNYHIQVQ